MSRIDYLRPSGAATWVVCSGYAAMRAAYPESPDEADNDIREDGTACHWLAAEVWQGNSPAEGSLSPNNRVVDEDMYDAVDLYHDVLRAWPVGRADIHIEQSVRCDVIHEGMTGTPDAWAYDKTTRTLYIADLKYGFRFVEVWENWQLVTYATALMEHLGINGLDQQVTNLVMTIVQPRSSHRDGPVRTWRVRGDMLRAQSNILHSKAQDAMKPEPPCTPNPGCVDCPARHACVALQNAALTALEISYAGVPLELAPAAIGGELARLKDAAKKLEARITGLEVQGEALLRAGQVVPGWTLAPTFARERWREGAENQVLTLSKYYGADLAKPMQPISPARARKLIPADVVAIYAHKPSTGVRLTKADPFEAKKRFGK